jgi:carbon starvation protein
LLIAIAALGAAYLLYGRFLAKKWGIDPKRKTPAYEFGDGVDYVPANKGVVMGHQFASIAGAGPINGPIQAAIFGWVPVLIWVLVGGIFIGAVHDFAAMFASVRSKGKSIGYIIEMYIGRFGKHLFMVFCWLFCILVTAAFGDIVAQTFNGFKTVMDGAAETVARVPANGSVAMTSMLFIVEAVVLGMILKKAKLHKWVNTGIAIVMLIAAIAVGMLLPMFVPLGTWHIVVYVYIFIASVVPVWALLQPRDYLNSYLLIAMLAAAVIGVFAARPQMNLPAFTSFHVNGQPMFPILFVTVACGAISGFHSLVSSGTASKQIKNERDMLPVSFGSMLIESLVAVVAIIAVASFASGEAAELGYTTPPQIFAGAVSGFLATLGLSQNAVFVLINLAVSAFALTSLDTVARIGRLSFQEFFQGFINAPKGGKALSLLTNKYVATVATLVPAYVLATVGYENIWPLFGSANQLLSMLALLACAVFLRSEGKLFKVLVVPAFAMMAVTFTALAMKIHSLLSLLLSGSGSYGDAMQLVFAVLLVGLGVSIAVQSVRSLARRGSGAGNACP